MSENDGNGEGTKKTTQVSAKANARKKVTSIISRVTKISESEITGKKLIRDDLGIDSMQAIESLALIEKELGIVIDPDKAFNVLTVGDLFALVEESIMEAA